MASPVVGIDLGTTNSAIGILQGDKVRLFPNPLGELLTPSVVALDPRTQLTVIGRTAKDLIATTPGIGAARFKLDMGTDRTFSLGTRTLTAIDLSAHVLDALRADAERALGQVVNRCVVSVPAYFDDGQRHATRQAAEQAGFVVERIINEPTAAAIAYGLHRSEDETRFMVIDLGGGTFDVCVMELFEGVLQVKSVAGESRLGGEDFTETLAIHLAERAAFTPPDRGTLRWALLYKRAELAKRALTRWQSTEVELAAQITGGEPRTLTISIDDVERIWAPLLERLHGPLRAALRGAGIDRDGLAECIFVGGATRMPCVHRVATEVLQRAPIHHGDPDLLVAEGAAIQAAMIDGAAAVEDLVVTDVVSHSLGISTSRQIGAQMVHGYFAPIIHRNTVIPTMRTESFSTLYDDQREITLQVFEGEARRVQDNRKIGELHLTKIPKGPAPKSFTVRFTYDQNGLLEVEAEIDETKTKAAAVFRRQGGEVTGAELEHARARLRAVRADPMDRPRYRDLHARAKQLWEECSLEQRATLDALLVALEAALDTRDPKQLETTYQALLKRCQAIDHDQRW